MSTTMEIGLSYTITVTPSVTSNNFGALWIDWNQDEVFDASERGIVACAYAGTVGAPALFSRHHFADLVALHGDRGAKSILEAHAAELAQVPFPEGATDLDTPEDWERFLKR